jgi:signal peptidase I
MDKPRSVVAAVLLSLPLPGLGHLYLGRPGWTLAYALLHFGGWGVFLGGWALAGWELAAAGQASAVVFLGALVAAAVHAGVLAARTLSDWRPRGYNLWYFYLLVWALAWAAPTLGLWSWVRTSLLSTHAMMGEGMLPGLLPGDYVRVDRRAARLARLEVGQVVAVRDPADGESVRLLRLVALGGQRAELRPDGLAVDDQPVARRPVGEVRHLHQAASGESVQATYLESLESLGGREVRVLDEPDPARRRSGSFRLAPDQVLVLGDNRAVAVDSSTFGPVPREAVLGVVLGVRFSRDLRAGAWRPERAGLEVR